MKSNKLQRSNSLLFPSTIDELFHRVWGEPLRQTWAPSVDVKETSDAYVIRAEIPGIDVGDVEVTVTGDGLTLEGEKKIETESDDEKGHISERVYGKFSRSFSFPTAISTEDVVAEAKKGVLTISVKKAEAEKTRRIEVKGE